MSAIVQPTQAKPTPTPRKYTRRSEAQWRKLIENFEHSNLTLEAYCQHHKIASSGFYSWRKRFENEVNTQTSAESLIDITPQLSASSLSPSIKPENNAWQVELELGRGCTLRISMT